VIPSLIVFGLLFGRWWRAALGAAALGWPAVLVYANVIGLEWTLVAAAGFAVANTAVGVLMHQAVRLIIRRARSRPAAGSERPTGPTLDA
jgi:hypothetical protein